MKRTLLVIAIASATSLVSAQDMMSKKGTPILPEAKDWSIGIDARPFLDYAGNLFNQNGNNAPNFGFTVENPGVITGKYMVDADNAYRAKVRIGFGSSKKTNQTVDLDGTGTLIVDSADVKSSGVNVFLGAGKQMYRGKGRLKGFYGAEAGIGFSNGKTTTSGSDGGSSYSLEVKDGSTFELSVRGFIGVEYFFAPKISIAGEFGWGLGISSTGASETTADFGGTSTTTKGGKFSSFGLDTDNASASINMNFYF